MIDTLGVTINRDGESWLTFSASGPAFALTPPFQVSDVRVSPGVRLGRVCYLDQELFSASKGAARPRGEAFESALQEVAWALPVPYRRGHPPVLYMRTNRLEEVLGAVSRLSGLLPGATSVTQHWVSQPRYLRDPRICDTNIGLVTCWGVTTAEQPLMREVERLERKAPLLWVTNDVYLIKSQMGRWVDADRFLAAAATVMMTPGFNPYSFLRLWAIQRFEQQQFEIEPDLYFLQR